MSSDIIDESGKEDFLKPLIDKHKKEFGVEPVIIGMFWDNPDKVSNEIIEAIEKGKPYNEEDLLSKEELEAFNRGDLLF